MSFWIEDANGQWLGDLTNFGATDIYEDPKAPDSLKEFMENGEADEELGEKIIEDLRDNDGYGYIVKMLEGAIFPVIVTDGVEDEEDL